MMRKNINHNTQLTKEKLDDRTQLKI